jgi:hypothetical protein
MEGGGMMDPWVQALITIIASIGASSGIWAFISKRDDRRSATTQLLLGLAHDRIIYLGMSYIERGWLTKDEYEDFDKYLWKPYSHFGGNGLAEKVMNDVQKLPIYARYRDSPTTPIPTQTVSKEKNDQSERRPYPPRTASGR